MKLLLSLAIMALVGCKTYGQSEPYIFFDERDSAMLAKIDTTLAIGLAMYASVNWPDTNTIKQRAVEEYEDKIVSVLAWWYVLTFFLGIVAASIIRYLYKHLQFSG